MTTDWRSRLHEIIFEADTPAGRGFDIALIATIVLSVAAVLLESVPSINARYGRELYIVEWVFTILFAIEYLLRLLVVRQPLRYATSFFGVVDLLAIVPSFLSLVFPGTQSLLVIRAFRILRIFRIFKLSQHLSEAQTLFRALRGARPKITVFLGVILATVLTIGAIMYLVEGPSNGFTSIPESIYWAIVTMTTVGYGDISPHTPLGKMFASILMIAGYGIIAVPTGILTTELVRAGLAPVSTQACPNCSRQGHDVDAKYCKFCGAGI